MAKTKINWATDSWNPITGCTGISEGCHNCYAGHMTERLYAMGVQKYRNRFKVTEHPECLDEPLHWKKPRRIFVCSMSDLFHEKVSFEFIAEVWNTIFDCPQHTFIILTKRIERARHFYEWMEVQEMRKAVYDNIWLGTTVENQEIADKRIPELLQIPAVVRFVSVEPMLSEVDLTGPLYAIGRAGSPGIESLDAREMWLPKLGWVICGSESGSNRRPCSIDNIRSLRDQCVSAGVPFFCKQAEINGKLVKMPEIDGVVWDQMPGVNR